MKKTLLLTLCILFSMIVVGQGNIYFINEDFSGSEFPEGWTKAGNGVNNWYISPSYSAGGNVNELQLSWSPQFNGIARFVSPAVDLTRVSSVMLSLDTYVSLYGNTKAKIGVATSSDNGATWNSVWSEEYTKTDKYNILCNISGPDMGKADVKFCLYFEGNSYVISGIYFDNFKVYTVENVGIETTSIDVPKYIIQGENPISFTVKNIGETTISSFETRCIINGKEVFSESFYTEMNYNDTKQFTFEDPYYFNFGEDYNIEIEIFRINDDELKTTNSLTKEISIALYGTQKTLMIEHFSSSTCAPCVSVNQTMLELTDNNKGKYTYTKYTVNGPGKGDPYYTNEVGTKMSYYNVLSVPQMHFDGMMIDKNAINTETFNNYYEQPAIANVRGSYTIEGNTINVIADFMTYFDTKDIKAYVSVNEKTTTGNAIPDSLGGNGETEFHHVMMKMLSGDQGTELNTKVGEYKRLELSYDMSTTHMEDINDLEVALWIQNNETKEIYNSHFAYENTSHCYPVKDVNTSTNNNSLTVKWDKPETGNPVGYNVYFNNELVAEKITSLEYTSENKCQYVEVRAVYENDMTSIGLVKIVAAEENVNDILTHDINIYPNPVNDKLYIVTEDEVEDVVVYDIYGRCQQLSAVSGQPSVIDVAVLKSGIYFVKINTNEGNIVKRIIKK